MPVKLTIGSALETLLLLIMIGPRLSGQDPPGTQPPTTKSLKPYPLHTLIPFGSADV